MTAKCAFCNQLFTERLVGRWTAGQKMREGEAARLCAAQFAHMSEHHQTELKQLGAAVVKFQAAFSSWSMLSQAFGTSNDADFERAQEGFRRRLMEMIGPVTTGASNGRKEEADLAKWW